jgi:hypothetical protein
MKLKLSLLCASACALSLISTASSAALILSSPNYGVAPGGNFTSSSGPGASLGPTTITYSGFDTNAYNDLYYAFGDAGPIGTWDTFLTDGPSLYVGTTEAKNHLAYDSIESNFGAGSVVWSGSISSNLFSTPTSVSARWTMDITDTSNNPLSLTNAASLGLDSTLGGVLDIQGDFKVTLNALLENVTGSAFDYNNGLGIVTCNVGDWCNALPVYNRLNGKPQNERLYTSSDYAFYVNPVPVPAAVWLFGSGLIGLVGVARRKKA